jgi:hypothetical protein
LNARCRLGSRPPDALAKLEVDSGSGQLSDLPKHPMSLQRFAFRLALLLVIAFSIFAEAQPFPDKEWIKADKPESSGFSNCRLALTPLLQTLDTSAMSSSVLGFKYRRSVSGSHCLANRVTEQPKNHGSVRQNVKVFRT